MTVSKDTLSNTTFSLTENVSEGHLSTKNLHQGKKEVLEDLPDLKDQKMIFDPRDTPVGSNIELDVLQENIHGPDNLQDKIRLQIKQIGSIYSGQIRPTPAGLPAFELNFVFLFNFGLL